MDIKFYAGVQTSKETPEKTTVQLLKATDCSVEPKYSTVGSQALGLGGAFVSDGWVSKAEVDGNINVELSISQLKLLLESAGFSSEPKNKNLEFKLDPNGFSKYLIIIKDIYNEATYDTASSCLVSNLKINATLQAYVKADASIIGMGYETLTSKFSSTPTVIDEGSLICLGTTIKEANTDITAKVESIDITIDRKLEGKGALNSIYNKSIKPSGKGEVALNLQFNEFDKTSYKTAQDMLKNNTSYIVEVWFADTKAQNRVVKFKFPKVKISSVSMTDLTGTGAISKEMKAYTPDGKDMPFELIIENYTL